MYFDLRNVDYPDSINSKKGFSWRYKEVNTKKCNLLWIFRLQYNSNSYILLYFIVVLVNTHINRKNYIKVLNSIVLILSYRLAQWEVMYFLQTG